VIDANGIARGTVEFTFPDGSKETHKLPSAQKHKVGSNINVLLVYPKTAPPLKQHLIVVWFERVSGGWKVRS
jgi:hypothetical protein